MRIILKSCAAAIATGFVAVNQAVAECWFGGFGDCGGDGGGPTAAPEFNGPGAIAALALLVSVVAIIYQRARK